MDRNLALLIENREKIRSELLDIEAQYDSVLEEFSANPTSDTKVRLKPTKDRLYTAYVNKVAQLERATASIATYSPILRTSTQSTRVRYA